jgi:Membrane protein involved in the export of O-antigen and teichoic acid
MNFSTAKALLKKLNSNQTFRNGILFTFFSFLNNGISFILLIILAKFISPDGYGKLNLFNTFISIVSIVISLSSNGYISVSFFRKSREDFSKVINSVFIITTVCFLFVLSIQLLFSGVFVYYVGLSINYQLIALLICYFQIFNSVNLDIWRLEEKPIKYGLYSLSIATLNFTVTLLLIISFKQGWVGRLNAQFSVALIYFIISLFFLVKRKLLTWNPPNWKLIKETLLFGLPLVPHLASSWIRQGLDQYIVNFYHSVENVGLFGFAFNFANIILIIGTAFNASNSVYIFKSLSNYSVDIEQKLKKQTRSMIIFFIVLTLLIFIVSYLFIYNALPKYKGSLIYLLPLCISTFFQSIYLLYVNYLFYYKKTDILMYITFSVSILHLALSYALTRYSIQFTAYISLISNFLIFVLVFVYSKKCKLKYSRSII